MINSEVRKANQPCWFVMRSRDVKKIDAFIDQYNADTEVLPENRVEEFFIPSLVVQQPINLVFIYTRPSAFDRGNDAIYSRYWGSGRTSLSFYTDSKGEAVTVRPQLMNVFINGCIEYYERITIHAKDGEITNGIEVTVRQGAFKDFNAEVYDVHYKANGVRFSVAIKFFANSQYIQIHDLCPDDVKLVSDDLPVFSDSLTERIQASILDIIRRRVYKKETKETQEADRQQLHQFYLLHTAVFDDLLLAAQFDSLMSICATLIGKRREVGKYNRKIKQRIKELGSQEINQEILTAKAYLLIALYISTKDACYRNEVKAIVMQQLPTHKALREFLSLIRR